MPAILKNHPRPVQPTYTHPYFTALQDLSGERINTSNGLAQIPWSKKLMWAKEYGVEDIEAFMDVLTAADDLVVTKINEKNAQKK